MGKTGVLHDFLSKKRSSGAFQHSFKQCPNFSGIVGRLGAFGGFVIPPAMGLFVTISPQAGYSKGFVVFTILTIAALGPLYVLHRYPPAEGNAL